MYTLIIFILVLGILVFVHELGHFIAAKRAGLRVEEFGFGFPPKIFGIRRGETLYTINLIPLGGFVKIFGEDGSAEGDKRSFASRRARTRIWILAAGIMMNLVLAIVLYSVGHVIGSPQAIPDEGISGARISDVAIRIGDVSKGSPAESAGIETLDSIVSFNGQPISEIADLQKIVQERRGKETEMVLLHDGKEKRISVEPRSADVEGQGPLGISPVKMGVVSYPWYLAPWMGLKTTFGWVVGIILGFVDLLARIFGPEKVGSDVVTGPVGIAVLTGQFARLGVSYLISFVAFLSVNLAIINALPFPALDGGRIFFVLLEKIRRKKISQSIENAWHLGGFALLMVLVLLVTIKDLGRFGGGLQALWQRILDLF